jgi:hypothetical protein
LVGNTVAVGGATNKSGCLPTSAKEPNVNNSLETSQNEPVNLKGLIVTSVDIVG